MIAKTYSTKQRQLLDTGKRLFFKYGLKRVTVAEICEEAGVSKMTFYKYYENKGQLAKAFLLESFEEGKREYRNIMHQDVPFSKKVEQFLHLKLKSTEDISQDFIRDILKDPRLGLDTLLQKKQNEFIDEMLNDFSEAAEKGEIRKEINPKFITYFLEKIREMSADEYLLSLYKNEQDLIMELTRFFFYGLGIAHEKEE